MSDTAWVEACLRRATSRAKSDVANKLVSMLLHEISRQIAAKTGMSVQSQEYGKIVTSTFGVDCPYCQRPLNSNRVAVEHLDGMNRIRLGLHVPGNVVIACSDCNREKRRDDQNANPTLADSGWEAFLRHGTKQCAPSCKTCEYWTRLHPDPVQRIRSLDRALGRLREFRNAFQSVEAEIRAIRLAMRSNVELLYRECPDYATQRIADLAADVVSRAK